MKELTVKESQLKIVRRKGDGRVIYPHRKVLSVHSGSAVEVSISCSGHDHSPHSYYLDGAELWLPP